MVPGVTLSLEINYPLSVPSSINIEVTKDTSVSTIINRIADEYRRIYKNPKEYGIWGHGIGDKSKNKNGARSYYRYHKYDEETKIGK